MLVARLIVGVEFGQTKKRCDTLDNNKNHRRPS